MIIWQVVRGEYGEGVTAIGTYARLEKATAAAEKEAAEMCNPLKQFDAFTWRDDLSDNYVDFIQINMIEVIE